MCCGTTANLIIKRDREWLTPSLKSGCLPGIMRQQGLEAGILKEAEIESKPQKNDSWLLINSLSCRPIRNIDNLTLDLYEYPENLWMSFIESIPE